MDRPPRAGTSGGFEEVSRKVLSEDFSLHALYVALREQRTSRGLSWESVAEGVNERRTRLRPIAVSTITSLAQKRVAEGDAVLQMLLWLRRTPESFVPGMVDPLSGCFHQPQLTTGEILRWDTRALFAAVDSRRNAAGLTWSQVADQIPGFTAGERARAAEVMSARRHWRHHGPLT